MDVADMRAVLAVAQTGSTVRAAELVNLSQPAMSRLVRRVEVSLGFQLFERSNTGVRLTIAGAAFCADLADIVQRLDRSAKAARVIDLDQHRAPGHAAELRVGFLIPAAAELTGAILGAYRQAWPQVTILPADVAPLGGDRALAEGVVDVAFLWTPLSSARLQTVPLFDDALSALLPRHHPLAAAPTLDEEDVAAQRFTVTDGMNERWQTASTLRPWRHHPNNAVRVANVNSALMAIAHGDAVSIGPRSLARHPYGRNIAVVPMNLTGRPTSVVSSRADDRRRHVQAFLAISAAIAQEYSRLVPYASSPAS